METLTQQLTEHSCAAPSHRLEATSWQMLGAAPSALTTSLPLATSLTRSSSVSPLTTSSGVRVTITDFIGNTLQTAYNLGDLNDSRVQYPNAVSGDDRHDFYRFRLENGGTVTIDLTGMEADADLALIDSGGNVIVESTRSGRNNEAIARWLNSGVYYIRVQSYDRVNTAYNLGMITTGTQRDPGSDFASARDFGNLSRRNWSLNDFVGTIDPGDYYRFDLSETGNFHLNLNGLSGNLDVALYDRLGRLIATSMRSGTAAETLDRGLDAGTYYLHIYAQSGSSNYALQISTDTPAHSGTRTLTGSLRADTFDLTGNYTRTVISGNGNVDFQTGLRDVLDLSDLSSTSVSINYAGARGGGVQYDPGNGTRVFDAIVLHDGRQILFEGVEQIRFRDRTLNLVGFLSNQQFTLPNDPLFNQQWNLHMMGVHTAWRFGQGNNQVVIGVQDGGIGIGLQNAIHPEVRYTIFPWENDPATNGTNLRDERASSGTFSHSVAVQSIIAAASNNGSYMTGINWESPIFSVDVLNGNDAGDQNLAQATRNMISWLQPGQRLVINMSLYSSFSSEFEALVSQYQDQVLFVVSTANGNTAEIAYPATLAQRYSNVVAVGASWGTTDVNGRATQPGDRIAYPGGWGSNYGTGLTLMGPSEVIAAGATLRNGTVFFTNETNYVQERMNQFDGTSAAAPNVAGVASLVWSANPSLTAAQVRDILATTAYDLGHPGYDLVTGHGLVNADAAVRRAIALT